VFSASRTIDGDVSEFLTLCYGFLDKGSAGFYETNRSGMYASVCLCRLAKFPKVGEMCFLLHARSDGDVSEFSTLETQSTKRELELGHEKR
jgi:hypothetical protein